MADLADKYINSIFGFKLVNRGHVKPQSKSKLGFFKTSKLAEKVFEAKDDRFMSVGKRLKEKVQILRIMKSVDERHSKIFENSLPNDNNRSGHRHTEEYGNSANENSVLYTPMVTWIILGS